MAKACGFIFDGKSYSKKEILAMINKEEIPDIQQPYLNYTNFDEKKLRSLMSIPQGMDMNEYMEFVQPELLAKVREYNPNISFSFDQSTISGYFVDKISISLSEIYYMGNQYKLDYNKVLKYMIEHESGHAITMPGRASVEFRDAFIPILAKVRELYNRKPFKDKYRGNVLFGGYPYALKNIEEFLADFNTNPEFTKWLKSISNGTTSLWETIQNKLRRFLGLEVINSKYKEINDIITSEEYREVGKYLLANNPEELAQWGVLNANEVWIDTIFAFENESENERFLEALDKLPDIIIKLKKYLDNPSNDINSRESKGLKNIYDNYIELQSIKDKGEKHIKKSNELVNLVTSAYVISKRILSDLQDVINSSASLEEKTTLIMVLKSEAKGLSFLNEMLTDVQSVLGRNLQTEKFSNLISVIKDTPNKIDSEYMRVIKPNLIEKLAIDPKDSRAYNQLQARIDELEAKLKLETNPNNILFYKRQIQINKDNQSLIPTKEVLGKILNNQVKDASWIQLQGHALATNSNAFLQSLHLILVKAANNVLERRIERGDVMQTMMDKYFKATGKKARNMDEITKHFQQSVRIVTAIEEDKDGKPVEVVKEPRSIISTFGSDYIFEYTKLEAYVDYYTTKFLEARAAGDEIKEDEYLIEKNKRQKELRDFKKQHVQREFKEEYYDVKDLLYETHPTLTVKRNGIDVPLSLMNMKGDLYAEQEQYEVAKTMSMNDGEMDDANLNLDRINIELKKIGKLEDDLGNPKTGVELWLAEQSIKYYDAKSKIGNYVLTDKGQARYNRDLNNLKKEYDKIVSTIEARQRENERLKETRGDYKRLVTKYEKDLVLAEESYNEELKRIQRSVLPQSFWDERKRIKKELNDDLTIINKIDDDDVKKLFAKYQFLLDETLRIKTDNIDDYDTINKMMSAYRDNDGVVDGIQFQEQKNGIDAVLKIKKIEEEQEELKKALTELRKSESRQKKELRAENQAIDDFLENYSLYNSMLKSSPSEYYQEEFDRQLNKLQVDNRRMLTNFSKEQLDEYYKENNLVVNADGSYNKVTKEDGLVKHTRIYIDESDFEMKEGNILARKAMYESEWYLNNHVLKNTYTEGEDGEQGTYSDEMVPIAIWQERQAADKNKFPKILSAISKYNEFIVNDNLRNKDSELIYKNIQSPKTTSVHYKPENLKMPAADLELRNSLKEFYFKSQVDFKIGEKQRLYYILPSVSKNDAELKIEFVDGLFNGDMIRSVKNIYKDQFGQIDDDNQVLEQGSNDRLLEETALRQINFRFNRVLDKEDQTKNIFASLLTFDNHNQSVFNKKENQNLFIQASDATKDLIKKDEFETKMASIFSWKNIKAAVANKGEKPEIKLTEKPGTSVLHESVKYMDDTFIAGQVKDDSRITIGGYEIDGHKLLAAFKKFMNRATFGLKVFSPLKNMGSQTINSFIHTSIAWGFATKSDYMWAQKYATRFSLSTINSIRKVGNRSKESKALDFFKVMQGEIFSDYGKTTQWTTLMEIGDSLTLPKHMMEFRGQVVQFLALSKANIVEVDGKFVPFHEAFFIDPVDGKYKAKPNALYNGEKITDDDIRIFRGKITEINRRLNGAMAAIDRGKAGKSVFGSASLYLGAFIMPGLRARFGKAHYNLEIDTQMGGYYIQAINLAGDMIKYGRSLPWETLSKNEKRRVIMSVQEFTWALGFIVLLYMMGGGDDKEELKKNEPMYNYLMALAMGVGSEVQTFIPFPGVGLDELQRKITSPFAVVKQINDAAKMLKSLAYLMVNNENAYYKTKSQDNSLHDKGDAKFIPEFLKLRFGLDLRELNGLDKLMQTKTGQQLRQ